jgi:hypothetical protein
VSTSPRSAVLGFYDSGAGTGTARLFIVPDGTTVILKDVSVNGRETTAGFALVWADRGAGGTPQIILHATLQTDIPVHWTGTMVFGPGDSLYVNASTGQITFWASGTILQGVAQQLPTASTKPGDLPALPITSR